MEQFSPAVFEPCAAAVLPIFKKVDMGAANEVLEAYNHADGPCPALHRQTQQGEVDGADGYEPEVAVLMGEFGAAVTVEELLTGYCEAGAVEFGAIRGIAGHLAGDKNFIVHAIIDLRVVIFVL